MTTETAVAVQEKTLANLPILAIGDFDKAKAMTVDDFKSVYSQQTAEEIAGKQQRKDMTDAAVVYMKAARGLGASVNEILMENEGLQKRWGEVMGDLVKGKDGSGSDLERKATGLPIIGTFFKKRIDSRMTANILEVLPDLLRQQWDVTEKAAMRVKAQMVMLVQAEKQAEGDYRRLGDDQIRLRDEAMKKNDEFNKLRAELSNIEAQLAASSEVDDLIATKQPVPEGKKALSSDDYAKLMQRRTEIMEQDNDREIELQTVTQTFRATKDGHAMTELQIGELNTTRKAMNAISIMLDAFLKVTRPIMMRSIVIMNAQSSGLKGATLLQALGQSMNESLKMCAYGMTVMTEQAMALGRMEFLEKGTVAEVKQIQLANDKVWNEFTKTQYEQVMQRTKPLLEHANFNGETIPEAEFTQTQA
ncbi:MAG: hypothetical protein WC848_02910 [Parcubacteria group bacterium]|jgi:hypothetical protein